MQDVHNQHNICIAMSGTLPHLRQMPRVLNCLYLKLDQPETWSTGRQYLDTYSCLVTIFQLVLLVRKWQRWVFQDGRLTAIFDVRSGQNLEQI
jgi:hypothetical protein